MIRSQLILSTCLLLLSQVSAICAQENYVSHELLRENNWGTLSAEDMNGDGRKDLIYSHHDAAIGRELRIHHQQDDGTFSANPQRIEIKTEIIGVGFADLRKDPGKEIILLASAGAFSLSKAIDGYAGIVEQLVQWDLVAAFPDREDLQFLNDIEDINNDGCLLYTSDAADE
mgnify:FL=1